MKRRDLLALIGGAVAWPAAARAQSRSPAVVGFLSSRSPAESSSVVAAFKDGLSQAGFTDGQNITIAFRWAEGNYARLPALAAELVAAQAAVIFAAGGAVSALAVKSATATIPIVFIIGDDPVQIGLAASLNRPGGNATGVSLVTSALAGKRLELISEMVPTVATIAVLVNANNVNTAAHIEDAESGARALGRRVTVLRATTDAEIEARFAGLAETGVGALVVQNDPFFDSQRLRLIALTARHRLPAIYHIREFPEAGGLMSYGSNLADAYRQGGVYAGRILAGARPGDLPIMQPSLFELVVNFKTAKALGLAVPQSIIARADEVIE